MPAAAVALLAALALETPRVRAAAPDLSTKVKAAFLLNFARFSTWPDTAFADESQKAPFVICVVGEGRMEMTGVLTAIVQNQRVGDRRIEVRSYQIAPGTPVESQMEQFAPQWSDAHMVYIDASLQHRFHAILQHVHDDELLLVSDCKDFAAEGGMLGLVARGSKIIFEANIEAIDASRVDVSSKILRLAEIVEARKP